MTGQSPDPAWLLSQIDEAIGRLSEPADEQLAHLVSLGSTASADELALELHDVLEAAVTVPELLTADQRDAVLAVDRHLDSMSGPDNAELWTEQALRTSDEWKAVRRLAKAARHALGR